MSPTPVPEATHPLAPFGPGLFRMPAHFGPTPGPRQGPDGRPFDWSDQPQRTLFAVEFLSDAAALQPWMPPGFTVEAEPVVRVELQQWRGLAWLAGRGYNTFGVKVPVLYRSASRELRGHFLPVLWENMPDAILSGREELGYNKIYAEVDDPREHLGHWEASARWFGHRFADLQLSGLHEVPTAALPGTPGEGLLHYKFVPGTGRPEPDAAYVTLTPPGGRLRLTRVLSGIGTATFLPTRWEDMPTQYHVVQALAAMPQLEARGAWLAHSQGARDLGDQQRVD